MQEEDMEYCAFEECGQPFVKKAKIGRNSNQRFCSRNCHYASQRAEQSSRQVSVTHFRCNKCELVKPFSDFNKYKKSKTGHDYSCRDCQKQYMRNWSSGDTAFRAKCLRYGITPEQYFTILERQGGGCAVCGSVENLHIDHDHSCCKVWSCGKCVRGILCQSCNMATGFLRDDVTLLRNLIDYLEGQVSHV